MYAHNSNGELPDQLRSDILKHLNNYRAGGIEVEVLPIVKVLINQTVKVLIEDTFDKDVYSGLIETSLTSYLNGYTVGTNFHVADVIHFIKSSYEDAVVNISLSSSHDIDIQKNEVIRPGTISVTCVYAKDWVY